MRATAIFSPKLERNLLAYATVASAAGANVLLLSQVTVAKVVYTKTHKVVDYQNSYQLDVNHDGKDEFALFEATDCLEYCYVTLDISGIANGIGRRRLGSVAVARSGRYALALQRGAGIDSKVRFAKFGVMAVAAGSSSGFGEWANVKNRYLGLKLHIHGETHYGWARLTVTAKDYDIKALLTGYAYETVPNKAIIAGNRGSTTGQGPEAEPVSLGRLALGAAARKPQQSNRQSSH